MGWIKLEKDLLTDPRLLRLAVTLGNGDALHGVTVALGALAHLWMIADTHVGNDDVLALSIDEIDQRLGVAGFCDLLPPQWLQVIDAKNVKLPGFHAHNGTVAKAKAQTKKRVEKHRKPCNATPLQRVTPKPLPDQDQDLDLDHKKTPTPFDSNSIAGLDRAAWERWRTYRTERKPAIKPFSMQAAAAAMAKLGDGQAAAVEFSIANGYQGLQEPRSNGSGPKPSTQPPRPLQTVEWAEVKSHAAAIGFRAPYEHESISAYRSGVERFEHRPASSESALAAIGRLAEKMRAPT